MRVYETLKENGVDTIYHANSVLTACQFLRAGSLLSRGTVDRRGLYQTLQKSDRIDRRYSIWFDVFTDSVDIHARIKEVNLYGPVLFVIDSRLIKKADTGKVWVTKLNPTKWKGRRHGERWFESADDLEDNFVLGTFDQMIAFRHCGGELPFMKCLKQIILDDPKLKKSGIDYYSMAYGALTLAITEGGLDVKISKRRCPSQCECIKQYESDKHRSRAMFIPRI